MKCLLRSFVLVSSVFVATWIAVAGGCGAEDAALRDQPRDTVSAGRTGSGFD